MNYFDQLLNSINDAEAREELQGFAQRVPELSDWVVDPETRRAAERTQQWTREYWDDEHGMPKAEYRQLQQIRALEAQVANGNGMELDELNDYLGKFMTEKQLVTNEMLADKERGVNDLLQAMERAAVRIPYLNQKHEREFGELFDPSEFLDKANAAKASDLDRFYNEYTSDKRTAKQQAEIDRKLAEAREEGRRAALQEKAMAPDGQMPSLDGGPVIGHFQKRIMGGDTTGSDSKSAPPEAELGRGLIAKFSARAGDQAELAGGRIQ
jgi:hypothetical protein